MSLRPSAANGAAEKQPSTELSQGSKFYSPLAETVSANIVPGQEKQKRLLASDAGHFSIIK